MAKIGYATKEQGFENPLPANKKFTFQDANEVKTSVNALYDFILGFGWVRHFDETHTEQNPQILTQLEDNQILIDGASSILSQAPVVTPFNPLWIDNEINAIAENDAYDLRFDFKAKIANADGWFELAVDAGGDVGKIVINTFRFPRGANIEHPFSIPQKIYTGSTFLANRGKVIIRPSHQVEIYDKSIYIERTHIGR